MAVGKRVRGALYIHRDAVSALPAALQTRLAQAVDASAAVDWNVARLEPQVVGLLRYADFEDDPFPALRGATRIDLGAGTVSTRDFDQVRNPLILHRKEQLVASDHPQAAAWRALTTALEDLGLFRDPHLIGRRERWLQRLADAKVRVEGHHLCPT